MKKSLLSVVAVVIFVLILVTIASPKVPSMKESKTALIDKKVGEVEINPVNPNTEIVDKKVIVTPIPSSTPQPTASPKITPAPTAIPLAPSKPSLKASSVSIPQAVVSKTSHADADIECTEQELEESIKRGGHSWGGDGPERQRELDIENCRFQKQLNSNTKKQTNPL